MRRVGSVRGGTVFKNIFAFVFLNVRADAENISRNGASE
jgi:hypothetical protein